MCVCAIAGIIMMASSNKIASYDGNTFSYFNFANFFIGLVLFLLGPVIFQLVWLGLDVKFNALLDVKNIRNAGYSLPAEEFPAPLFFNKKAKDTDKNNLEAYEKLKKYKLLYDEKVLTDEEYENIKNEILGKNQGNKEALDKDIDKVKKLKAYVDDKIISEEEFVAEKSKIFKK